MPEPLDVARLPLLSEFGFTGGRDSFRRFCRNVFQKAEPRFLRTERNSLVVFRHADLQAFGTAKEIGNVPIGILYAGRLPEERIERGDLGTGVAKVIASQVFTFNDPLHGPARRILTHWLGPRQVALMEEPARALAREIASATVDGQVVDFVETVSERLTVGFWAALLDLTPAQRHAIGGCTREMTRLFRLERSPEDATILDTAFAEYACILEEAACRGLEAGNPMLRELAAKLDTLDFPDNPMETGIRPKSLGEMLAGNLVDGFHTAALASANAFFVLAQNPELLADAKRNPALLGRAIVEALRIEPPVLMLQRFVLRDFPYAGSVIPAGSTVTMMWGAGNLDPAAFPAPERFDPSRLHAGLMTFGTGLHICPGRYVGVMLIRVMIEAFEASGVEFSPAEEAARWLPGHSLGQLASLPMRMRRRAC